jgi:hypothetical protein
MGLANVNVVFYVDRGMWILDMMEECGRDCYGSG